MPRTSHKLKSLAHALGHFVHKIEAFDLDHGLENWDDKINDFRTGLGRGHPVSVAALRKERTAENAGQPPFSIARKVCSPNQAGWVSGNAVELTGLG